MVELTMQQNGVKAELSGESGFGFAIETLENGDLRYMANSGGSWDAHKVCCVFEALAQELKKNENGKIVLLNGLNMFIYELQTTLTREGSKPRVKVFVDNKESGEN